MGLRLDLSDLLEVLVGDCGVCVVFGDVDLGVEAGVSFIVGDCPPFLLVFVLGLVVAFGWVEEGEVCV